MRRDCSPIAAFDFRPSPRAVWLAVVCWLLCGCAIGPRLVELRSSPYNPLAERLKLSSPSGPKPSSRTRLLLRAYALDDSLKGNPYRLLNPLTALHEQNPTQESAYALAELSYLAARRAEIINPRVAVELYFNCVSHAYGYLFDAEHASDRNVFDPQFRGVCDLYNSSLEHCLRLVQKHGEFLPGRTFRISAGGRPLDVQIVARSATWRAEEFDSFEFVSDYDLKGLPNHYRTYGLGVPLIARRRQGTDPPEIERHYAPDLSFPVTALLRLETHRTGADGGATPRATLELYDPLEATEVEIAGQPVPLESDVSTPLAYFLDNPALRHLDTFGLVRPDIAQNLRGLYMVQPYQSGKIPVLMIHGLWSSPMTWMEALNDLRASHPEIRENYQFWFYLYPTGQPFWKTAADLRDDLQEVRRVFRTPGDDPRIDRMVLVGHSMGGLIARLLTLDSGDAFWNRVSPAPLAQLDAPPETREELQRVFYFEPDPAVARVVTIATPHRGSDHANSFARWLARSFIRLPMRTVAATTQLIARNPDAFRGHDPLVGSTSIDGLNPESPILQVMLETPTPPGVRYHNILGVTEDVPLEENTDGIVPYRSAHLADAESEVVVRASHVGVHRHPRAILELKRILLEHLREQRSGDGRIIPLEHLRTAPAQEVPRAAGPAVDWTPRESVEEREPGG